MNAEQYSLINEKRQDRWGMDGVPVEAAINSRELLKLFTDSLFDGFYSFAEKIGKSGKAAVIIAEVASALVPQLVLDRDIDQSILDVLQQPKRCEVMNLADVPAWAGQGQVGAFWYTSGDDYGIADPNALSSASPRPVADFMPVADVLNRSSSIVFVREKLNRNLQYDISEVVRKIRERYPRGVVPADLVVDGLRGLEYNDIACVLNQPFEAKMRQRDRDTPIRVTLINGFGEVIFDRDVYPNVINGEEFRPAVAADQDYDGNPDGIVAVTKEQKYAYLIIPLDECGRPVGESYLGPPGGAMPDLARIGESCRLEAPKNPLEGLADEVSPDPGQALVFLGAILIIYGFRKIRKKEKVEESKTRNGDKEKIG